MGFSPLAIADRVGHEAIEITYNYAHLFPSKQQDMAKQLSQAMQEAPEPPDNPPHLHYDAAAEPEQCTGHGGLE